MTNPRGGEWHFSEKGRRYRFVAKYDHVEIYVDEHGGERMFERFDLASSLDWSREQAQVFLRQCIQELTDGAKRRT